MPAATAHKDLSFQQLVAANRAAGRLSEKSATEQEADDDKRKMIQAGLRLTPEEHAEAKAYADADERSIQWFTRRMYLAGLELFKQNLVESQSPFAQ